MKKRILGVAFVAALIFGSSFAFSTTEAAAALTIAQTGVSESLDAAGPKTCRINRPRPKGSNTSCVVGGNTTFRCDSGPQGNACS